jgi:hypothetical protein
MKFSSFLLFVAIAGIMVMSSCVKNYTCQCTISYSGTPGLPDTVTQQYSISDTKSGATSKCKGNSGTYSNNGIATVESCVIY